MDHQNQLLMVLKLKFPNFFFMINEKSALSTQVKVMF